MRRFCHNCEQEQDFNGNWDEDCLRCEECGSLPYSDEEWRQHEPKKR